jgi:hypothetical protein
MNQCEGNYGQRAEVLPAHSEMKQDYWFHRVRDLSPPFGVFLPAPTE